MKSAPESSLSLARSIPISSGRDVFICFFTYVMAPLEITDALLQGSFSLSLTFFHCNAVDGLAFINQLGIP